MRHGPDPSLAATHIPCSQTGYMETLEAAERYTHLILGFGADHPIDAAGLRAAAAAADDAELAAALHRVDAELMRWASDLGALYERASSMAVVSTLQPDATISMTYDRPAGAGKRPLKRQFHPQRDASILLYLLLSAAVFLVQSPPLAALVLVMNVLNLLICLCIKVWRGAGGGEGRGTCTAGGCCRLGGGSWTPPAGGSGMRAGVFWT